MTLRGSTLATPIVAPDHFLLATRDAGYRNLVSALTELVDNSLQAGATRVSLQIRELTAGPTTDTIAPIVVGVLDNGSGMSVSTLAEALQFGGSSRFDDRSGLGRFGMGLPNSAVSHARRLDVYSWQERGGVHHTYLDVDEVVAGALQVPPDVADWIAEALRESADDKERFHRSAIMTLQQRYLTIQAKLDTAYDDRLAGRISDELWLRKSREWEAELASARRETASHERASRDYATTGSRILELAKNAHNLFVREDPREQANFLRKLVSNSTFDRGSLLLSYVKPFDLIVEGNETGNWLGAWDSNQSVNSGFEWKDTRQDGGAGQTKDQHETTRFTTPLNLQNRHPGSNPGGASNPKGLSGNNCKSTG